MIVRICRALLVASLTMIQTATAELNVVVVLDDSGSMANELRRQSGVSKIQAAKTALKSVLEQLSPEARVGIVLLNGRRQRDRWIVPLGPVDNDDLFLALDQVQARGGTPLGKFMKVAADELLKQRAADYYGEYRLLIVTDGEATDASLVKRYLPDILSRGLTVDVIGVDMSADHSLATKVHSYRRADDPEALTQALREVFAETSQDSAADDENDFELLASIPSEIAAAALAALAESGNHAIGQRPPRSTERTSDVITQSPAITQSPDGEASNRAPEPNQDRKKEPRNRTLLYVAIAFVLWIIFSRTKSRTKSRRRR